jgi:hypothetical protein
MWRNKFGRRVFRFEEEWTTGSANQRDREYGTLRSEARVHVIRSDKTLAEIRDLDGEQLFSIAADAVKNHFKSLPGQTQYVSVLVLDTHWDGASKTIAGHAAHGGGVDGLQLAVYGSHCLQSYPTSFEEVVPAFSDCTPTDTNFVANDGNEAGSSWEAANVGIGAHLRETGRLFGLPHQESGVMPKDFYVAFSRTFLSREAYSTRTKSKGELVSREDECTWHRLDCLRFRSHPCFRLPNDPVMNPDSSVQAWPVEGGNVVVTAATGISYLEIFAEGDDVCHTWVEYPAENGAVQRNVSLSEQELRNRLPEKKRKGRMRLSIKSHGGGIVDIDDFKKLCSKDSSFKLGTGIGSGIAGKTAYRGKLLGLSQTDGSQPDEVVFASALRQDRVLSRIIFYHGHAVDGLEFVYDDDSRQLFGKRGGKEGGDVFDMGKIVM